MVRSGSSGIDIDATIQARMGASRLPGKMLLPIAGEPLLVRLIERIRQCRLIDRVIVATSVASQDDAIERAAAQAGAECFRGSETDVLGRVVGALRAFDTDVHVEFQGDNLLPDSLLVDSIIGFFLKHRDQYDFVSNSLRTTYPPGTEVAVYAAATLFRAEAEARPDQPREHVSPHIYRRPDLFRCFSYEAPPWLHEPDMHFEIDTAEDYDVVCRLYQHFLPGNPGFSLAQAIDYARASGVCAANRDVPRRWRAYR
jgi:spore coat polysaccharide biosynthesis protein SpsF